MYQSVSYNYVIFDYLHAMKWINPLQPQEYYYISYYSSSINVLYNILLFQVRLILIFKIWNNKLTTYSKMRMYSVTNIYFSLTNKTWTVKCKYTRNHNNLLMTIYTMVRLHSLIITVFCWDLCPTGHSKWQLMFSKYLYIFFNIVIT